MAILIGVRGNSSVGRAQPCQGWGRGFESRFPLFKDGGRWMGDGGLGLTFVIRLPPSVVSGGGEMVDAGDLKSPVRKDMWVRFPPLAWNRRTAVSANRKGAPAPAPAPSPSIQYQH